MNLTLSLSSGLGSAKCNQYSSHCKINPSGGNPMPSYSLGATQRTESRKCTKTYADIEREGAAYWTWGDLFCYTKPFLGEVCSNVSEINVLFEQIQQSLKSIGWVKTQAGTSKQGKL